jgi:hypothetical protein
MGSVTKFSTYGFFIKQSHLGSLIHGLKPFLQMVSNSRKYITLKFPILAPAQVSMPPLVPKTILRKPLYFLCDCYSYMEVQFACVLFFIFPLIAARGSRILGPRHQQCHFASTVSMISQIQL